jgi:RNA polymerase sigma factor (sigma-70 family)
LKGGACGLLAPVGDFGKMTEQTACLRGLQGRRPATAERDLMTTTPMNRVTQHILAACERDGMTDGELVNRFLSHQDDDAIAALIRRHGPMVWGVCRRLLRSHHDAEDAFQATFLVLVKKAATLPNRETVGNWLYGVAHQTAVRMRAMVAKRGVREKQVEVMPEPATAEQYVWNDLAPVVDEELSRLPDKYRVLIVLCDLEGVTRRDVAQRLGIPEGTTASRLATARAMLAKRLARRGVVMSGVLLGAVLSQQSAWASVPALVVSKTIKVASFMAAGQAAKGVMSVKVAALTEGVLKAMFLNKLKGVLAVGLVALICIGGGVMVTPMVMGKQPDSPKKADDKKQEETKEAAVKAMQERLQGTWKCVFMHHNGVKSEPDMIHTIKGNSLECKLDGRVAQSCTFKLVDLDASPKQIDSLTTFADAEVVGERKDKTQRAIFMLDGDTLIMCVHDDERPKCFITQAGDGCTMAQFKRVAAK